MFNETEIQVIRELEQERGKNVTKFFEKRQILYEYVHFIMKIKKPRVKNISANNLNVVLLVLDGVSLSSMKRALPKTLKFLKGLEDFFLFEKHHVIGENTFENIVPMLTNMYSSEILGNNSAEGKKRLLVKPFDSYPFIWKNFSQRY